MRRTVCWIAFPFMLLTLTAPATPAQGANRWVRVTLPPAPGFIDTSTVIREGSHKYLLWMKLETPNSAGTAQSIERARVDCNARTIAYGQQVDYDAAGNVRGTLDLEFANPSAPIPDTFGEAVVRYVCGERKDSPP